MIQDNEGKTPLELAEEFPSQAIRANLVKILKEKKIPFIETGHTTGRYKVISIVFVFFMASLIGGYMYVLYWTKIYYNYEMYAIATFATITLICYAAAMLVKPEYSPLPSGDNLDD